MTDNKISAQNGIWAATLTPLDGSLKINPQALEKHIKWLLGNSCNGIVLFGTTGEANSFTVDERCKIITDLASANIPAAKIMIGTGCCAQEDTVKLTKTALKSGFNNVLLLPPFYYKDLSDQGLFEYFKSVFNEIADDAMRVYLYHFPRLTGVPFTKELIKKMADAFPGVLGGIKDSGGDFENMKMLCREFPALQIFSGTEKFLYDILKINGAGCISATANITSHLCAGIFAFWNSRDVSTLQKHLSLVRSEFEKYPFIPALKSVMAEIGDKSAWQNIRPPNVALSAEESKSLLQKLKQLQIFT